MDWFEKAFDALPDPRTGNATRHDLLEILTIALTATVCGAESCSDFADFAVDREDLFREFRPFSGGTGYRRPGMWIAIDGKTLRRSFDDAARTRWRW